jgi:hypothetical protein
MQENHGMAIRIARFFPVDFVNVGYAQKAAISWFLNRMHDLSPLSDEYVDCNTLPSDFSDGLHRFIATNGVKYHFFDRIIYV